MGLGIWEGCLPQTDRDHREPIRAYSEASWGQFWCPGSFGKGLWAQWSQQPPRAETKDFCGSERLSQWLTAWVAIGLGTGAILHGGYWVDVLSQLSIQREDDDLPDVYVQSCILIRGRQEVPRRYKTIAGPTMAWKFWKAVSLNVVGLKP